MKTYKVRQGLWLETVRIKFVKDYGRELIVRMKFVKGYSRELDQLFSARQCEKNTKNETFFLIAIMH